jgi:hypothetical protein
MRPVIVHLSGRSTGCSFSSIAGRVFRNYTKAHTQTAWSIPFLHQPKVWGLVGRLRSCERFLTEGHGGEPRRAMWGPIDSATGAEPVVELGGRHGPGHEVALRLVAIQALEGGVGDFGLDALGDHAHA